MISRLRTFSRPLKYAAAAVSGCLLVACESMGPQDSEQFIFIKESEPLFVEFDLSMNPSLEMNMPSVADNMKDQRRRDYMAVMQELVYLYKVPVDVHLLGERERPGEGPVLDIHAIRFEQDPTGEIRATIQVRLHRYGEVNTLGIYNNMHTPPLTLSERQLDEAYQEAIRKPLQEMLEDLMLHFQTDEDREMIEAPLRDLD